MFDRKHGSECRASFKLMGGYFHSLNTENTFLSELETVVGL